MTSQPRITFHPFVRILFIAVSLAGALNLILRLNGESILDYSPDTAPAWMSGPFLQKVSIWHEYAMISLMQAILGFLLYIFVAMRDLYRKNAQPALTEAMHVAFAVVFLLAGAILASLLFQPELPMARPLSRDPARDFALKAAIGGIIVMITFPLVFLYTIAPETARQLANLTSDRNYL